MTKRQIENLIKKVRRSAKMELSIGFLSFWGGLLGSLITGVFMIVALLFKWMQLYNLANIVLILFGCFWVVGVLFFVIWGYRFIYDVLEEFKE